MSDDAKINVKLSSDRLWTTNRNASVRGATFVGQRLLSGSEFVEAFAGCTSFEVFVSTLRQLNGFYAAVVILDGCAFLAVDHARSLPLFYAVRGDRIFVSDDAYWIREQIPDDDIDDTSVAEFLLTRLVSGRDTLLRSVKQVQAGEAVAITSSSEGVRVETQRIFLFNYVRSTTDSFETLETLARTSLLSAFKRLIEFAAGRTIVVPLGGGYDSRLVLLMLKMLGFRRVVAFTYGRPGGREVRISKEIASGLGFTWLFIPYSNRAWRDWYSSDEWVEYSRFANGLSTTPHLQDWPAVWELKEQDMIPDNSVFVPGHGPTPSDVSQRLPSEWLKSDWITVDELANKICEAYCVLQDWTDQSDTVQSILRAKVKTVLQPAPTLAPLEAVNYFDRWGWESLWAKFLVNSARVYEYWGYSWWFPLLDLEWVDFWMTLSFNNRVGKRFQKHYARKVESEITGRQPIEDPSKHDMRPAFLRLATSLHLRKPIRRIRAWLEYDSHPFAWYGIVPKDEYKRAFHGQENINSYLSNQTIRSIFPTYVIPQGLDFLAAKRERNQV